MGPRVVRVMTCQMGGVKYYEPAAVGDGAGGNVRPPRKMLYDSRNTPDEFPGGAPSLLSKSEMRRATGKLTVTHSLL